MLYLTKCGQLIYTKGDIDYFVSAPLTLLRAMDPIIHNVSAEEPKAKPIVSALKPKGGFVNFFYRKAKYIASGVWSRWTGAEEAIDPSEQMEEERFGQSVCSAHSGNNCASAYDVMHIYGQRYSPKDTQRLQLSSELWSADVVSYIEPQHFALRTSMLSGVGFQVDHLAVLWCHQVLSVVLKAMRQLDSVPSSHYRTPDGLVHRIGLPLRGVDSRTITPNGSATVDDDPCIWLTVPDESSAKQHILKGIVKRRYTYVEPGVSDHGSEKCLETTDLVISPVAAIMRRNALHNIWRRAAFDERDEIIHFFNSGGDIKYFPEKGILAAAHSSMRMFVAKLQMGWMVAASLIFITQRLHSIIVCYVVICGLALTAGVLERMSSSKTVKVSTATLDASHRLVFAEWMRLSHPDVHWMGEFCRCCIAVALGERLAGAFASLVCKAPPFGSMTSVSLSMRALLNVVVLILALLCFSSMVGYIQLNTSTALHSLGPMLEWTTAYALALFLWVLTGLVLLLVRATVISCGYYPLERLIGIARQPAIETNVEVMRRAPLAAAAAASSSDGRVGMLSYLRGECQVNELPMQRPSSLRFVLLLLLPLPLAVAFILMLSSWVECSFELPWISCFAWFYSDITPMRILCSNVFVLYPTFFVVWLASVIIPTGSSRAPQWASGALDNKSAEKLDRRHPALAPGILLLASSVTWPILLLAYPSFDFAFSYLFSGATLPIVLKILWRLVVQMLIYAIDRSGCFGNISLFHETLEAKPSDFVNRNFARFTKVFEVFGPGMVYVVLSLYVSVLFLVIMRR